MDVICFGQQNWDYCWTGKQQLMSRLATRGHRVLYVDPQWSEAPVGAWDVARALRRGPLADVRRTGPGQLFVHTYRYLPPLRYRLNRRRWRAAVPAVARGLGFERPAVIALHPGAREWMRKIDTDARLYYAVDELSAFGDRSVAERQRIRAAEEALIRESDVVLAVSPRLLRRFRQLHPRAYLLPNAADLTHFAPGSLARACPHPRLRGLDGPQITFVGQVDERLDQDLLVAGARARRDAHWVLAGRAKPGVDLTRLEAEPNIHLLGYQPYEDLPGVLRESTVCVVPYVANELTRSCSPLKVYEYLATGRPVVATPIDGLEWCAGVVDFAATPEAFLEAVDRALADPSRGESERRELARRNGWPARVEELEGHLEAAVRHRRRARAVKPLVPQSPAARFGGGLGPRGRAVFGVARVAGAAWFAARVAARLISGTRPVAARRILFVRRSRLGDLVTAIPALRALRWRYPSARIDLGVQPGCAAAVLLQTSDLVDGVVEIPPADGPATRVAAEALRLFARGYDVMLTGADFSLIREAYFCGAPRIVSLADGHALNALATSRVPLDPHQHEAGNNMALAERLTGPAPAELRTPLIGPTPSAARSAIDELLATRVGREAGPLVVVHTGAQRPSRKWPLERFRALVAEVLEARPTAHVLLTGIASEAPRIDRILAELPAAVRPRAHSLAGATGLWELTGLLRRADAAVTNDTGLLHLARACATPLVAVLGPENELRWGPDAVGAGAAVAMRMAVPCAPCKRWDCPPHYCLRSLGADRVAERLLALLDRDTGRARPVLGEPPPPGGPAAEAMVDRHTEFLDWPALWREDLPVPLVTLRPAPSSGNGKLPGGPGPDPRPVARRHYPRVAGNGRAASADRGEGGNAGPYFELEVPPDGAWSSDGLEEAVAEMVRRPATEAVSLPAPAGRLRPVLRRRAGGERPSDPENPIAGGDERSSGAV